ncbi:MAG: hypothetical protein CVU84_06870 [Firmicutes bacterium HGW-Firmicutes-1]|jgi:YjbE family integral membrane protein|nr:MAG: hypothetical protein CVU84_06870 [Firmicutes bacterium HGW-Firmicutes-1]
MIVTFFIDLLRVMLFNLLLSIDNISIIALSVKDFPDKMAKRISLISMSIGIVLKIFISTLLINIFMISWLPVRLIGGIILLVITWNLLRTQDHTNSISETKKQPLITIWKALIYTVLADMGMSFENLLAITVTANGKISIIILALVLSLPILLFGCCIIEYLMKKYNIIVYLGIAVLAYTSLIMVLEDKFIVDYIPTIISNLISIAIAALVVIYGIYSIETTASKAKGSEIQ